jgi:hypothetical protein
MGSPFCKWKLREVSITALMLKISCNIDVIIYNTVNIET